MEEPKNLLIYVQSLIQSTQKGLLIQPEIKRLSDVFSYCEPVIVSNEQNLKRNKDLKGSQYDRFESETSNGSSPIRSQIMKQSSLRGSQNRSGFGGLFKASESKNQCLNYINLTLQTAITIISSIMILHKMKHNPEGIKMASLAINHRLRISRVMILLHLMTNDQLGRYLDNLDKVEANNLLQLLQAIVSESSIIERFTFSTFEQVVYGSDTFQTVKKIKTLLRGRVTLLSRHVCNHRDLGVMLDSYFQQHTTISYELLINALIIHYNLSPHIQDELAFALQQLSREDPQFTDIHEIDIQDFILFTDFISIPTFLTFLENGCRLPYKTEDELFKDLQAPPIKNYQLLKSYSKFKFDALSDIIIQRLITLNLMGMTAVSFSQTEEIKCKVTFENSLDSAFVESLFAQLEEMSASFAQKFAKQSFQSKFKKANMPKISRQVEYESESSSLMEGEPDTFLSVCKQLQRIQSYQKHRMLELINLESREKDFHAAMTVLLDTITTYKPQIIPGLVRFNDELFSEFENEVKKQESAQAKTNSLLSNIIRRLEQTNLQHEKLASLRKLQKQKEKKQITSERIESETSGPAQTAQPVLQYRGITKNKIASDSIASGQLVITSVQPGQNMVSLQMKKRQSLNSSQVVFSDDGNLVNYERTSSIPQGLQDHNSPTLMMQQNTSPVAETYPNWVIEQMRYESEVQSKLITHIQHQKSGVLLQSEHIQGLLHLADLHFSKERIQLIKSMHFHDDQIIEKEQSIRDMLAEIAFSEMNRNVVTEELEESILKTIEVINISDIKIERENLERDIIELERKQQELERTETDLVKDKERLDEKRRKRRLGITTKDINNQAAAALAGEKK